MNFITTFLIQLMLDAGFVRPRSVSETDRISDWTTNQIGKGNARLPVDMMIIDPHGHETRAEVKLFVRATSTGGGSARIMVATENGGISASTQSDNDNNTIIMTLGIDAIEQMKIDWNIIGDAQVHTHMTVIGYS